MGYAHKNTMLSKCGFADEDRKESKHDLACAYIRDNISDLLSKIAEERDKKEKEQLYIRHGNGEDCPNSTAAFYGTRYHKVSLVDVGQEVLLTKGEGQYKTTVGFADVIARFSVSEYIKGIKKTCSKHLSRQISDADFAAACDVETVYDGMLYLNKTEFIINKKRITAIIEVKAGYTQVSDITRQLELYRSTLADTEWSSGYTVARMLAACYPLSNYDKEQLIKNGIRPIQLGEKFENWLLSRESNTKKVDVIEM